MIQIKIIKNFCNLLNEIVKQMGPLRKPNSGVSHEGHYIKKLNGFFFLLFLISVFMPHLCFFYTTLLL